MIDFKQLLLGGSATAVLAAVTFSTAQAQQAAEQPSTEIETISSSASRIQLQGFEAPTPVSVISSEAINRDAKVAIGDEIREMPQIRGGQGINSGSNSRNVAQGDTGIDTLSLRNLGTNRNLVLFDRQRIVSSTIQTTQVDLATIPQSVIQRVDVVTGGASAAWGSDAVTGVINLVINKTFEGFKGSVSYSNNTEVDHQVYKAEAAWGTSFLGGKGHTLWAGTFTVSNDVVFRGQLPNDNRQFVYNSAYCSAVTYTGATGTCSAVNAGQPLLVYAYNTGNATTSLGGLINNNSAGVAGSGLTAGGLTGQQFIGSPVTVSPFSYGTVYNGTVCYNGCSNNAMTGLTPWDPVPAAPYHSATYFNYTSYQITPDITASIQLNYSRLSTRTFGGERQASNVTVYADNPYLPDSVAQRFVCQGGVSAIGAGGAGCVGTLSNGYDPFTHTNRGGTTAQMQGRPTQTLTMGLDYLNNTRIPTSRSSDGDVWSLDNLCSAIGVPCSYASKAMMRGVFTLDGHLGDNWVWNAYIQNGTLRMAQAAPSNAVTARLTNAMDAVRVTSGNVGTSGLPIGSIQCRGLLNPSVISATKGISAADEIAGCVPMNQFGSGNMSAASLNYVEPGLNPISTGIQNRNLFILSQTTGAFSVNGILPWQLPAGEIAIAAGGEYRLEQAGQHNTDIRTQNTGYGVGNVVPFSGQYNVEEGFVEADAPLLKNDIVQSLDVSLGGRITNYSSSGLVETWKLGATSQITDEYKVRVTWSYDIRAPSVWDLYSPGGPAGITCQPFVPGNGGPNPCFNVTGGNANLQPEKANTISAGMVFTPSWINGLTASVDWYQIHLHGGIITPSQNTILTRCRAGEQVYCNQIQFQDPGNTLSPIAFIFSTRVNAALLSTAGFDMQVAYGFDLFNGTMDLTFNGNYTYDFTQNLNGQVFQGAGATGGFYSGGPKFQGTFNANYREGPWSFGMQARITGDSVMDLGTENVPGLVYKSVTYTKVNGVDVATVGAGQNGAGINSPNYNAIRVPLDLRASYKWDNNITLFGAVDNVQNLPTDALLRRAYRVGVRFAF